MNNHDAAQKVTEMSDPQKAQLKKNLYGLICKCLAAIALLGAIGAFFVMGAGGDDQSRYQNEGVVSQALVVGIDDGNKVRVVHDPSSTVAYSQIGTTTQLADLPTPVEGEATGTVVMSDAEIADIAVGQIIPVVNTPYEPFDPHTLASVQAPASSGGLLWAAILLALAVVFLLIGRRVSK